MAGLRCGSEPLLRAPGEPSACLPVTGEAPEPVPATRILCVGNPWFEPDRAGALVHDRLARARFPRGVEVIDAGLGGLALLRYLEGAGRVILVDATLGLAEPGQVALYDCAGAIGRTEGAHYGHDGGLPYLLGALPAVVDQLPAEILLIGLEPPVGEDAVDQAVSLCLSLVKGEKIRASQPLCW